MSIFTARMVVEPSMLIAKETGPELRMEECSRALTISLLATTDESVLRGSIEQTFYVTMCECAHLLPSILGGYYALLQSIEGIANGRAASAEALHGYSTRSTKDQNPIS